MGRIMPRLGTMVMLGGWLALALAGPANAEDRTADQVVKELEEIKLPQLDAAKRNDKEAVMAFLAARREISTRRATLIGELMKVAPDDARLTGLAPERWNSLVSGPDTKAVREELDGVLASTKNPTLAKEAAYFRAVLAFYIDEGTTEEAAAKVFADFEKRAEKDRRIPSLKLELAAMTADPARKMAILDEITKDFAGNPIVSQVQNYRTKLEGLGKPFVLEFNDAIKGSPVSIKGLKGKVVVIDFWATWCGPCIAEMPKMKALYAQYRDQGVEFIGVSLDQPKEKGGLDKLKEYVEKNQVEWPQYYQGNYWQSEFSSGWAVNSIPCVFLVDADGKLASVDARGKLARLIPDYLAKAKVDIK